MRPVFLLHMAVVVFLVGAGPGEPDHFLAFLKIAQQMPVQELAPVVGVEAQQFKWQRGFHGSGGFHNAVRTFVPYRPVAGPSAQDVAIGHAPDEVPFQTTSTVRHRVGFQKSGPGDVPVVGADRYLGFEQPPGLGAATATVPGSNLARCQKPIHLCGADG